MIIAVTVGNMAIFYANYKFGRREVKDVN